MHEQGKHTKCQHLDEITQAEYTQIAMSVNQQTDYATAVRLPEGHNTVYCLKACADRYKCWHYYDLGGRANKDYCEVFEE